MADKKPDNQKNAENQKKQAEIAKKQAEAKARKAKKQDEGADEEVVVSEPAPPARLSIKYRQEIVPALQAKLGVKNIYAVPKLEKIVISMGVGRFATEGGEGKAKMEKVEKELSVIAGQKPLRCKAKKSVANYKVREGQETGLKVTLRGTRMYEFLDRMITLAFPRVKDFRGVNPNGFDKDGNYNFGFTEQTVFPEVDGATVTFQQGMNVTMVTSAKKAEDGRELLKQFGFPFRTDEKDKAMG
ncbi:50S ribosomal protein L5 [Humisphaera borealis]|uniref:Large ribosomal subunit protein uL5 n=1 Tax=Humisphaera borealis TaxID=2807512 RepID=A0A7M2WRZ4_9BACT|nr:50S ribosomal protein L5 [Humisphaera borealis]QOV88213.1 50S ribosomal protein L5 [Humisphaera borealis]